MYEVSIKKTFSAAHMLKEIGGKCENLHGHNFTVEVTFAARKLNPEGLVVDFRLLKDWTGEILELLDHRHLNELPWFEEKNPSAENIAAFIYARLEEKAVDCAAKPFKVTVWESENARASFTGALVPGV